MRLCLLILAVALPAAESRWHAVPADARPAQVGVVRVWPSQPMKQVRVERADGTPVGARLLWSAVGQPTELLFDASGGGPVTVIPGGAPGPAWEPKHGLVLETRRRVEGPMDTWDQFQAVWKVAEPQGKGVVPHVFDGLNRFGPSEDYCSLYDGWLRIETTGDYRIATISDDGSWLRIDDRPVTEWPGWHGPDEGLRGRFSETVHLAAGLHRFRYAHVQGTGGSVAEAAWKVPGSDKFAVIPPEAFGLTGRWRVDRVDGEPDAVSWEVEGHCRIDDKVLVTVRVRAIDGAARGGAFTAGAEPVPWTGADARVVLPPGTWTLTSGKATRQVRIDPLWSQHDDWDDTRWAAQRRALIDGRATAPLRVLVAGLRMAKVAEDAELTARLSESTVERLQQKKLRVPEGSGEDLGWIALRLQEPDARRYEESSALFSAAIAAPGLDPAAADRLRLNLAGLRIHAFGDGAAAEAQLKAIDRQRLSEGDRRLAAIYSADARLALGDVEGCRSRLAAVGDVVDPADTGYALRRRVRLELARDRIARGEFDTAEQPLREIEWETPRERLGTETGPLLAQVWMGRQELPFALTRLRFLAAAAPDDQRAPDVLLLLVKAQLAAGDRDGARATIAKIKTDHPYSEAAARLADIRVPEGK